MNQELKHRLIGAVVVTALATIFIPMLFDDPIDDTGQLVSELNVPTQPENTAEQPANKSPTSIDQTVATQNPDSVAAKAQTAEAATIEEADSVGTEEDLDQSQALDTSENGTDNITEEEMGQGPYIPENAESMQDEQPTSLDTGIKEANQAVKNAPTHEPPASHPANSKAIISGKPLAKEIATPVKKSIKEPAISSLKAPASQPSSTHVSGSVIAEEPRKTVYKTKELPKKPGQVLERWYLQAGSFGRKDNALSLFEELRKQGLPVVLETVQGDKGALYRLKVGPELSKKRAADLKARLEKQKIKTMLIAE
ncbi:MAG: SPOR domain-containing protein [Methylococcaceae bacterium]|nr:SPOR domain-containing protein [Methylococcaceae bacterium]